MPSPCRRRRRSSARAAADGMGAGCRLATVLAAVRAARATLRASTVPASDRSASASRARSTRHRTRRPRGESRARTSSTSAPSRSSAARPHRAGRERRQGRGARRRTTLLGRDRRSMAYLNLGTGIAAGLRDRRQRCGAARAARRARSATSRSTRTGPLCRCGQRGCIEAFASGSAIAGAVADERPEAGARAVRRRRIRRHRCDRGPPPARRARRCGGARCWCSRSTSTASSSAVG